MAILIRYGQPQIGAYQDMPAFADEGTDVFSLADFPIQVLHSGGLSNEVGEGEMMMVYAECPKAKWIRQVWKTPGDIISDTMVNGSSMFEFMGHYNWEIKEPGMHSVEITTSVQHTPIVIYYEVVA